MPKKNITDKFWGNTLLNCPADLAPWLRDRGSLTRRIQQRCTQLEVRASCTGLARIALDEAALLGVMPQQLAYSREVFLYANNNPVVFAHSALARTHLRGTWSVLLRLGNKPLGAVLFAHPLVKRKSLSYKRLHHKHPLYQRAAQVLNKLPHSLWARRSLFYLHDAPLLVTEIFLPEILRLPDVLRPTDP